MIQGNYNSQGLYGQYTGKNTAGQKQSPSASFLDLAAQAQTAAAAPCEAVAYGTSMSSAVQVLEAYKSSMVSAASGLQTDEVSQVQPVTLEEMLKAKYPGIKYHVFDASTSYWKTRNDYPHYLLYQDEIDTDALENWKPSGPNPAYTPFEASKEIRALGAVPPGSKAVVIHPTVQARMDEDPEYAKEIMERIDTWFTFDVLRNEAILPGCTAGMSQAVAIGEDGCIVNAVSSSQPRLTKSGSEEVDWWDIRKARHAYYMSLITEKSLEHRLLAAGLSAGSNTSLLGSDSLLSSFNGTGSLLGGLADYQSAQAARTELAKMMEGDRLREIFGPNLGGVPTETVLEITKQQVWGDQSR